MSREHEEVLRFSKYPLGFVHLMSLIDATLLSAISVPAQQKGLFPGPGSSNGSKAGQSLTASGSSQLDAT